MELIMLTERTGYFDNPSAIGMFKLPDQSVLLIDSGLDDDSAKKVLKILAADGLSVSHVVNTHAHADHCGGNALLRKRTEAVFISSRGEKGYIEWPATEPHYLYGAYPPKALRSKFLQAKPSIIDEVIEGNELSIGSDRFEILRLPGHSPDMIGLITPDGVAFVGDAVFDKRIVEKHKLLYHYDLGQLYKTLDLLGKLDADQYVLSHGGKRDSLESDLMANKEALDQINELILSEARNPITKNDLHKALSEQLGLSENIPGYFLNDSLLGSHLGYLVQESRLELTISGGEALYVTKK